MTAGGTTFTWPQTAPGVKDNIAVGGQELTLAAPAGATSLNFLGAATNGSSASEFVLNYRDAAGQPVAVPAAVEFGDWCAAALPGQSTAFMTQWRSWTLVGGTPPVPFPGNCGVFASSVSLDPSLQLESVTLTPGNGGTIHLFDVVAK